MTFVVAGGTALTGRSLTPLPDAVIVIEDGTIAMVARAGEAEVPSGAEVVDATGMTVLPGFIDAHVHIGLSDPHDVVTRGVTTVRDLGWLPELIHPLARRSQSDGFDGPTVLAAGPILTAPGGYPDRSSWAPAGTARPVSSPTAARSAVAQTAEEGASVIKIALNPPAGPVLDPATVEAIVTAAHELGMRVTGHVHGRAELDKALDAGLDELAHMLMSPERITDEMIARMVAQGMTVVPTLSIRFGDDQNLAIDNLARFADAGGRVVYGTDLGNEGPSPGIDGREVAALARAGLDGRAIVASATVGAARWLGLDRVGVLEAAKDADLVVVEGDPLEDPSALTRVRRVIRRGRTVTTA